MLRPYVKYLLAVYLGIAGFAYLFQLQVFFSVIVMAAASIFVPTVFLMNYKNLYEEKKFEDLTAVDNEKSKSLPGSDEFTDDHTNQTEPDIDFITLRR